MDEIINGAVTHMIGFVEKVDAKLEGQNVEAWRCQVNIVSFDFC